MKTEFWMTGKTDKTNIREEIDFYLKRIRQFIPFEIVEIKPPKSKSAEMTKENESEYILKQLRADDFLILLDEKGKEFSSPGFSKYIGNLFNTVNTKLVFVAGGAYGFNHTLIKRANSLVSLSKMTFTHDMVRIIFMEQFYRALTIMNNHPYQH